MDKRSFNFLFTVVAISMVALGTYKIAKKKNQSPAAHPQSVVKNNK